jgi:hypothetical protein
VPLVICCSPRTREVDLGGSAASFVEAADLFTGAGGRVVAELTDPAPYETCLAVLGENLRGLAEESWPLVAQVTSD